MAPNSRGYSGDDEEEFRLQSVIENLPFVEVTSIPPPRPPRPGASVENGGGINSYGSSPTGNGVGSIFHRKSFSSTTTSPGESIEKSISSKFQRFAGKIRESREAVTGAAGIRGRQQVQRTNEEGFKKSLENSPSPARESMITTQQGDGGSFNQRISCVEAWNGNIYIGSTDGYVFHYVANGNNQVADATRLLFQFSLVSRNPLVFGAKPVEKILVLPSLLLVVILCDSTISFYTLPNLNPITKSSFPFIRGVCCLAENLETPNGYDEDGSVFLIAVKRRSVQILRIREIVKIEKEISVSDSAGIVAERYGDILCMADMRQYLLINLRSGQIHPLMQISPRNSSSATSAFATSLPTITSLGNGEFLLSSGSIGIFVSSATGDPVRGTLEWPSFPRTVKLARWPYVIALLKDDTIQIHNIITQQHVQTLETVKEWGIRDLVGLRFGGIRVKHLSVVEKLRKVPIDASEHQPSSNVSALSYALKGRKRDKVSGGLGTTSTILVIGKNSIRCVVGLSLLEKVDKLLCEKRVEEALELSESQFRSLTPIDQEAMSDEMVYIYQRSGLIYLCETLFDDAASLLTRSHTDPRVLVYLFPQFWSKDTKALRACFAKSRTYSAVMEQMRALSSMEEILRDKSPLMRETMETNALEMLRNYLEDWKKKNFGKLDKDLSWLIDTTLFNVYEKQGDQEAIVSLVGGSRACRVEDFEEILISHGQMYSLSLLYMNAGQVEKAVEVWEQLLSEEKSDTYYTKGQLSRMLAETLNAHGELNLLSVIGILPSQWPLQNLEAFLARTLRASEGRVRETQVLKALARGENLGTQAEWVASTILEGGQVQKDMITNANSTANIVH